MGPSACKKKKITLVMVIYTDVMDGCYCKFDEPDKVVSTAQVGPLTFAELWHGPTGAFKDLSITILGRMVNFFLKKRDKRSTVIVATSGDTGSSAMHSVLGLERIQVLVMYPRDMVSRTQELQMTTLQAPNVHVFSMEGTSDDADIVMSTLFSDLEFSKKYNLNVFNSLNVCRVLVQAIHFIYLYLNQCPEVDQDVLFAIPTGGMGNVSSGMLARTLGLPMKFLLAVNENDTVHQTFQSGIYTLPPTVQKTLSSAMDIVNPYNMERVFYYLSGENSDIVKSLMDAFTKEGKCVIPPEIIAAAKSCISTDSVSGVAVKSTMKEVWDNHGYLICPHTAVATRAALDLLQKKNDVEKKSSVEKVVIICTATVAKFAEAAQEAGLEAPHLPAYEALRKLPERKLFMNKGENWPQIMKQKIEEVWKMPA